MVEAFLKALRLLTSIKVLCAFSRLLSLTRYHLPPLRALSPRRRDVHQ
jgi:hypothetical protein